MAALLSSEMDGAERDKFFVEHIEDCRRMGIEVLPPNINDGQRLVPGRHRGEDPLRAGGDQGGRLQGRRGDRQGTRAEKGPFHSARRLLRTGLDQGRRPGLRRDADPRRRLRLPRGQAARSRWRSCPARCRPARPSRKTANAVSAGSLRHLREARPQRERQG